MKKHKDRKDFYLCVMAALAILTIADITYIKYTLSNFLMNGEEFSPVGMMTFQNSADGKIVYFPVYKKR